MAEEEKITVREAIEFFKGEVWSCEAWLEKFATGRYQRGALDIEQHIKRLRFRRWVLSQLEKSIK